MKIRKPRIGISKKGVSLTNIGARIGDKRAGVNLSRKGVSGSVKIGKGSYNTRKGCSLPLFGVFIVTLIFVACAGRGQQPTQSEPVATAFVITLICADCAEGGLDINLWDAPTRTRVTGHVPHGTRVTVLETASNADEGRQYYHVTAANGESGWLPEDFVQK